MIFPVIFVVLVIAAYGTAWPLIFIGLHKAGFITEGVWVAFLAYCLFWGVRPAVKNRRMYMKIRYPRDEPADDR